MFIMHIQLSPTQQAAYEQLASYIDSHSLIGFVCEEGCGRTTILRQLADEHTARLIGAADIFTRIEHLHPFQIQEGLVQTLLEALATHDLVILDDYFLLERALNDCYQAARPNLLTLGLDVIFRALTDGQKRLVLGLEHKWIDVALQNRCQFVHQQAFGVEDYQLLFQAYAGEIVQSLDFGQVHQFAAHLDGHQISKACKLLEAEHCADTESFIAFLESHALTNNVDQTEVDQVLLSDLIGAEEVIRQLEIDIITPLERKDLADQLGLLPKRGILLYGPPGTGKTSIGRALAHQLGNKFFLLDGTVISGTNQFYYKLEQIIEQARQNAPSILFIDDCDLLFENTQETGLYRYLLTVLDGLESKSNSQITVMLTAMNIGSLPPALIRSGRVELWLEMTLPDLEARMTILKKKLTNSPFQIDTSNIRELAHKVEGFTGADLKRIVADAANLYGYDVAKEKKAQTHAFYLEAAIEQLIRHRQQLASAPKFTAAHQAAGQMFG